MNNELALQPREISANTVVIAQSMGEIAYKSGIYSAPKPEAAAMIMLKGYELGFPMTAAAEYIQVIDKQIGLTPRGALALMRAHPEIIRSVTGEDIMKDGKFFGYKAKIVRIENGRDVEYVEQFTLDDAQKAQLLKPNSGWDKYPRQMCKWRAIGFAADMACPDLLGGMTGFLKMPETMTDEDAISFESAVTVEAAPVEVVQPETPEINLNQLLSEFDAGDILAANGGAMPKTNAECTEIYNRLKK